jgi:hypothetical protein
MTTKDDGLAELRRLAERNIQILRHTLCHVGAHVWVWSHSGTTTDPDPDARCHCQMFTWRQMQGAVISGFQGAR